MKEARAFSVCGGKDYFSKAAIRDNVEDAKRVKRINELEKLLFFRKIFDIISLLKLYPRFFVIAMSTECVVSYLYVDITSNSQIM